jgi:hypothetical protein
MTVARRKDRIRHEDAGKGKSATGRAATIAVEFAAASPIRAAFWRRASSALRRIAEQADERSLTDAVSAPTDEGTLARAVAENAPLTGPVAELDPLAALIARGAEQKLALLQQAGGALPVSEVAKLLRISRQAVDKRRREGKLLAVPRGGDFAYPACQFEDDGVVPGLSDVLKAFGAERAWGALAFLVTPDAEQLDGLSPLEALKRRHRTEALLRLAGASRSDGFG